MLVRHLKAGKCIEVCVCEVTKRENVDVSNEYF